MDFILARYEPNLLSSASGTAIAKIRVSSNSCMMIEPFSPPIIENSNPPSSNTPAKLYIAEDIADNIGSGIMDCTLIGKPSLVIIAIIRAFGIALFKATNTSSLIKSLVSTIALI